MTKQELIQQLNSIPDDAVVLLPGWNDYGHVEAMSLTQCQVCNGGEEDGETIRKYTVSTEGRSAVILEY